MTEYLEKKDAQPLNAASTSKSKEEQPSKLKKTSKKRKSTTSALTTYIIHRTGLRRGQRLIKINIYEVKDPEDDNYSDSESAIVSAQYAVDENNNYDIILDATNDLIKKIGQKLYDLD